MGKLADLSSVPFSMYMLCLIRVHVYAFFSSNDEHLKVLYHSGVPPAFVD